MSSVTRAPAEQGARPDDTLSTDPARRGRIIVLTLLGLVLVGSGVWWVFNSGRTVNVTSVESVGAQGVYLEIEYAPVLPTTVTGAEIMTGSGSGAGSLYDNAVDSDAPPSSVAVRLGHSVSVNVDFVPDCSVSTASDQVTVILQTSGGDRQIETEAPALAETVQRWCNGPVRFEAISSMRDAGVVGVSYLVSTPTTDPVRVFIRGTGFEAAPMVVEPRASAVEWQVTSDAGCDSTLRPVAVVDYADGTRDAVRLASLRAQVC
jgi:hypothetical protein